MLTTGWINSIELAKDEIIQREYEGCAVPDALKAEIEALNAQSATFEQDIAKVRDALNALTPADDFGYEQPDDLEAIRALRPEGPRKLDMALSQDELRDRLHGAWTGRSVGCALGKPVEGLGQGGYGGKNGRASIKSYLEAKGHWPLDYYFSEPAGEPEGTALFFKRSMAEKIAYMEPDDDIHYTLIGLRVLETAGPGFQWWQVADCWNLCIPYGAICTAETQAILNYNMVTPHWMMRRDTPTTDPAFTRNHNNPYREWIGAQIRADGWAYACAGNPELAAEFAWRDAHWTHSANGIYGEMMAAAMIAAAFVEHDPRKLVEIGLSEIPANCKLAEAVREALDWVDECPDFEAFMEKLEAKYGDLHSVHTVNNALVVVMSLFYGEMDPDKSIAISVMAGLDTDCNGATVGSIAGAAAGKAKFGGKMQGALNDTIKPGVVGFEEVKMADLAERHLRVWNKVNEYQS